MTAKEKLALAKMAEGLATICSPPVAMFDFEKGFTAEDPLAGKLLDSKEYRRGWSECRRHVYAELEAMGIQIPKSMQE